MQVNSNLQILPWYNYPLITFLQSYIKPSMNIFEFGTGCSTIFYAQKLCNVFGVECNAEWITKVQELATTHNLCERIAVEFCAKSHEMARYINNVEASIKFVEDSSTFVEASITEVVEDATGKKMTE